jgi:PhnB protein
MKLYPFLTFNGNCAEAMHFYQSCFGGKLQLNYLGDGPHATHLNSAMKKLVLQAILSAQTIKMFASDLGGDPGLQNGNRTSLLFKAFDKAEFKLIHKALSTGGIAPALPSDFSKGQMVSLTDRYGVHWVMCF